MKEVKFYVLKMLLLFIMQLGNQVILMWLHVQRTVLCQFPAKNTTDLCASAIAQLQAAGVSQTTIDTFVMSMEEVVQDIQDQVKETAMNCLFSINTDIKSSIEQSFHEIENPFTMLNSISK